MNRSDTVSEIFDLLAVQQQFEILEFRITEMIERMQGLQSELARLQARVDTQEKMCQQHDEERRIVSQRISKILEVLSHVAESRVDNGT